MGEAPNDPRAVAADETPQPPEDDGNEDEGEFQVLDEPDTPHVEPGHRRPDDADETSFEDCMSYEEPPRFATAEEPEQVPPPYLDWGGLVGRPRGPV